MEKFALVTGANRVLGFETYRQLSQRGFRVVLTSRERAQGELADEMLHQEGLEITFHQLDVTRPDQVSRIKDFIIGESKRLDVLVNNAGVSLDGGEGVFEVAESVFERTLAVNFYGALRLTRAFTPLMKRDNYGRVVNVSSTGGLLNAMGTMKDRMAAYRVSKAALNELIRLMANGV